MSEHLKYYYANGNNLLSFNLKNDSTKGTLTHKYIEIVISKPTTTWVWKRRIRSSSWTLCWTIKGQDKAEVVVIQSVLCEVTCEQNIRGLEIFSIQL